MAAEQVHSAIVTMMVDDALYVLDLESDESYLVTAESADSGVELGFGALVSLVLHGDEAVALRRGNHDHLSDRQRKMLAAFESKRDH